jgi:lysophospholipase L1-like esterase
LPPATQTPSGSAGSGELVTAIGDSVMRGVVGELQAVLGGNVIVDADQGRLPWNTPDVVRNLRAAGKIGAIVVLHIGDNGFFGARVFDQVMAELKDVRRVVVINLKVPRNWEGPNNTMLAEAATRYPNIVLVDWHTSSAGHPELFWEDGIHLRPEGAKFFAQLIALGVRAP